MKKLAATVLSLALAGALTLPTLAAPEQVAAPAPESYNSALYLNGEALDVSQLPAVEGIPMRLVSEADHGYAEWYPEEGQGFFLLNGNAITVTFATGEIDVNGQVVEGTAQLVRGVTFLPAEVVDSLEGIDVNLNPELDVNRIDITTPNGAPLVKLAYQIIEETGMAQGTKNTLEEIDEYLGIRTANFAEIVSFTPMMVNSDTVIIGKLAEGGDRAAAKADLKARQDAVIASFEHYLPGPLELAKNGKVAECGDYLMLIISPDTGKAIELFEAAANTFS